MSAQDAAAAIGISSPHLRRHESGQQKVTIGTTEKWTTHMGWHCIRLLMQQLPQQR